MICKPCTIAADYGLTGIHNRCTGCTCEHQPLASPPRLHGSAILLRMLATAWRPVPNEEQR